MIALFTQVSGELGPGQDALLSIRLASLVFAAGARTSGAIRNPLVVPAFAHAVTLRHARSPR